MKRCTTCGIEKEETEFFKKRKNSLEGFCKQCRKQKEKDRIDLDPEKYREKQRLRSEKRRETEEWKIWRKDYQIRKRDEITKKARIYYDKNEQIREKARIWREKNRENVNESLKKHRKNNPVKFAAYSIVRKAINGKILVRPEKCEKCMKYCNAEAHHEDYMKPLDVKWLCHACHRYEHRKVKD